MALSKIEWTDFTFNPWWGCVRVSPGCEHCYAETFDKRIGGHHWGPSGTAERRFFGEKHWAEPFKWNAKAERDGVRKKVFCASMADVFEDNPMLVRQRAQLFRLIERTPNLDWLLLTKRPENILPMSTRWTVGADSDWPLNVWIGTTVESQEYADKRIPELLKVPASVRFLSVEPLLGPVDLRLVNWNGAWPHQVDALRFGYWSERTKVGLDGFVNHSDMWDTMSPIDWVIVGGESGAGARPMHPDWVRSLRDQCQQAAGVSFFFKQWGEWAPLPARTFSNGSTHAVGPSGQAYRLDKEATDARCPSGYWPIIHLGKHRAGRELDGRTWDELPEPKAAAVAV